MKKDRLKSLEKESKMYKLRDFVVGRILEDEIFMGEILREKWQNKKLNIMEYIE